MESLTGWILEEKIGAEPVLSQGDLIVFPDQLDPLKKAGIVVTADCDLQKKKHALLVTLVPIVSVKAILESYLLLDAFENQREQIKNYLCKEYKLDMSEDEILIAAKLRALAPGLEEGSPQQFAINFLTDGCKSIPVGTYNQLMKLCGSQAKAAKSIESQLAAKGDIVILPSPEVFRVDGQLAWVRHIWQEQIGKIALRTSDVAHRPGERVARLDSPYRYRLTQVMAQVFSDIGLPEHSTSFLADIQKVMANV